MTTDDDKIRYLAKLAGWNSRGLEGEWWTHPIHGLQGRYSPDYPHSLDAIDRDLLPILRDRKMHYDLSWTGSSHRFDTWEPDTGKACRGEDCEPARAAFEAIWRALKGGEE